MLEINHNTKVIDFNRHFNRNANTEIYFQKLSAPGNERHNGVNSIVLFSKFDTYPRIGF